MSDPSRRGCPVQPPSVWRRRRPTADRRCATADTPDPSPSVEPKRPFPGAGRRTERPPTADDRPPIPDPRSRLRQFTCPRSPIPSPVIDYPVPMPHHLRRLLVVIALLSVPASLRPAAQSGPDRSAHVVLISLDGFTARALADPALPLPTLRRLAKDGAMARVMTPVKPDRHLGQSHVHHQRRDTREARRHLQRPAGARARHAAEGRAVAGQVGDGSRARRSTTSRTARA